MSFQAIEEVKKPQASAATISNKGNIIVLDGDGYESYIFNKGPKQNIPIYQENGVHMIDVDVMVEDEGSAEAAFRRPV